MKPPSTANNSQDQQGLPGASEALRGPQSERRLEEERDRLFNLSLDLLCVANFEGQLEQVNPAWTQCLGWSAAELTSRPMRDFIHPDDQEATTRTRARITKGNSMRGFENRYRCRDGSYRWLSWNVHPLHDDRKVFAVARDVTERKQSEAKIHRLNRLYAMSSGINEAIVRIGQTQELYESACRIAVERGGLLMAWVGLAGPDEEILKPVAHWGSDEGYLESIQVTIDPTHIRGKGPGGQAFRNGGPAFCNDIENASDIFASRVQALERGYRSCAAFPLKLEGNPSGILAVYSDQVSYFGPEELQLLNALAENLSFAVEYQRREEHRLRAEAALRSSEATMAAAQRIGHFGSWELELPEDPDACSLTWSDEMYRIAGLEPESVEITNERFFQLVHPDDHQAIRSAMAAAIRDHGQYSIIHRLIRPDGVERIVHESARIFFDEQTGRPVKMVGNAHDITEQRRAEQTLRESEQRFRELAENIDEVFWILDPASGQTLYVSPAYQEIWGRTCESLYASPADWLNVVHPDDRARVTAAMENAPDAGEYDEMYRILRADGELRWIHDRGYPLRNEQGEIYRMVGTAEDITRRKRAEEKLREQATLLDKAQDAIVVRDLNHRILYWNCSAERLYGWTAAQAVGRSIKELVYRDSTAFLAATAAVLAEGEWIGEIEQCTREGEPLVIEGRWTLVRDDQGNPQSILAINTDITERKKLEQQFLRAQRMESIGTLAGGIAHDLNNVLAPIMMSVDVIKMQIDDPKIRKLLDVIGASARRGADMVGQVLSFARGMDGRRVTVHVSALVKELVKITAETFPKNIRISVDLEADLWALEADPTQLHQVLLNLCVNARDAMPHGGGRIDLRGANKIVGPTVAAANPGARPGPHVCLEVEDDGTGMPASLLSSIFDPFFTTKELGKGTGLGLSTAMAIVKGHQGFIQVQSTPGRGSKFLVFLPATGRSSPEPNSENERNLPLGNGETVLLVDDEASIREVMGQTLGSLGYKVLVASNGAEAVARYASHPGPIDLVLTDLMMPVMDGPSLIRALKCMEPTLRAIGASGVPSGKLVDEALEAGAIEILPKPYGVEILLKALRAALTAK
jgi:PAS domain S-box-containing protein